MPEKLSPILGLPVDDVPTAPKQVAAETPTRFRLSVIVPARNEEKRLIACVQSLIAQDEETFRLGEDWELLLVDDASTDGTRAIMNDVRSRVKKPGSENPDPGHPVVVLGAPPLDTKVWTGKAQACWIGAKAAQGRWLLFTDADTVHEPRSLSHALYEAEKHRVALLSYSPRQIVTGVAQRTLMPLVFSELASVYKMSEVNDPESRVAAANGQFLMVERGAYFATGGHQAVAKSVLEDVDLAWNVKRSKRAIRFRYAPEALSTRMYVGFADMAEGWTKNLALLFPHALSLAAWRMLDLALLLLPLGLYFFPFLTMWQKAVFLLLWVRTLVRYYRRVARSHFPVVDVALSPLGLPLFVYLLVRSWMGHNMLRQVSWKGREYRTGR